MDSENKTERFPQTERGGGLTKTEIAGGRRIRRQAERGGRTLGTVSATLAKQEKAFVAWLIAQTPPDCSLLDTLVAMAVDTREEEGE